MIVLVTGATGFIGRRLIARLVSDGMRVKAIYRREPPSDAAGAQWLQVETLDDSRRWDEVLPGTEAVVHLAALAHQIGQAGVGREAEFRRVNTEGTKTLAAAGARSGIRRLVFVSSIAAALASAGDASRGADYGRSKLEAERAIGQVLGPTETDWCILRPPLVYGPGNPGNMARLLRLIDTRVPLPLGSIRNLRSFVFVDNLVDAIVSVLRDPGPIRETFTVSDGTDLSTPALVRALAAASGRRAVLFPMPVAMLRAVARVADVLGSAAGRDLPFNSYSVDRLIESVPADGRAFRERFAWKPPVAPQDALAATCRDLAA